MFTCTLAQTPQVWPSPWSCARLAGLLVELSGTSAAPLLTAAFRIVLDAQQNREPVAWITRTAGGVFYPPDAARAGIDLETLAVVHTANTVGAVRAADLLVRSGGFGLIVLDLAVPERPVQAAATTYRATSPRDKGRPVDPYDPGAQRRLVVVPGGAAAPSNERGGFIREEERSGDRVAGRPDVRPSGAVARKYSGQGSPLPIRFNEAPGAASGHMSRVLTEGVPFRSRPSVDIPIANLTRLAGLAHKHETALVFLTEKPSNAPSLGSLIAMRAEVRRQGPELEMEVLKDKRRGPGAVHR